MRRISLWLRFHRYYRSMVVSAWQAGRPLDRKARATLKAQARTAARRTG